MLPIAGETAEPNWLDFFRGNKGQKNSNLKKNISYSLRFFSSVKQISEATP